MVQHTLCLLLSIAGRYCSEYWHYRYYIRSSLLLFPYSDYNSVKGRLESLHTLCMKFKESYAASASSLNPVQVTSLLPPIQPLPQASITLSRGTPSQASLMEKKGGRSGVISHTSLSSSPASTVTYSPKRYSDLPLQDISGEAGTPQYRPVVASKHADSILPAVSHTFVSRHPDRENLGARTKRQSMPFPGFGPAGPGSSPGQISTERGVVSGRNGPQACRSISPLRNTVTAWGENRPQACRSISPLKNTAAWGTNRDSPLRSSGRPLSADVTTTMRRPPYSLPSSVVEIGGKGSSVAAQDSLDPWSKDIASGLLASERLNEPLGPKPEWRPPVELSSPSSLEKFKGE